MADGIMGRAMYEQADGWMQSDVEVVGIEKVIVIVNEQDWTWTVCLLNLPEVSTG